MMYWMAEVVARVADRSEHAMTRAAMFIAFVRVDWICRRATRHFSTDEHEMLCGQLETALVCYNALAQQAIMQGFVCFGIGT